MMEILSNLLRSNKKGQAALEFYIYAGAFLFFLGLIGLIFVNMALSDTGQKESELAFEVGGQYADMINFALIAGDGFQGAFYPPKTINGKYYTAYFGNMTTREVTGFVLVSIENTELSKAYTYPLNTKNITGELEIHSDSLNEIVLNNTKGSIHITVN